MSDASDATADAGTAKERDALVPGAQLGKYRLERVLGAGGMGVVWCAHDPDLERSVAIKLLLAPNALPEQRARLLREARAMARLKHPNVLTVYEVDSEGDRDFIAMELVEGTSMDRWLAVGPPPDEIWDAVIAAGRGLAAAHAAGLVHRDFKPHNVLRSKDGRILVTDFGLARGLGDPSSGPAVTEVVPARPIELDVTVEARHDTGGIAKPAIAASSSGRRSDAVLDATLTQPGALIGTPAYMAPEQFLGAPPDPRTDQFAFCVAAWQALTGERPFKGDTLDEIRKAASGGVAHVDAKLPRGIRAVLARGLASDPAQRWPDLDALLVALERARLAPRRRRALGIALFGIAMAIVLFVTTRRHTDAPVANPNGCEAPVQAFAVWTPEHRAAFEKRLERHPNAIAIADALDTFRTGWIARYLDACAGSGAKTTARLNCLLGERDDLDGFVRLTDTLSTTAIVSVDLWGLLPALDACDGDSPIAPPLLPEKRKQRDAIVALRSQLAALRRNPDKMLEREAELVAAAKKLEWRPLVAEVLVAAGSAAQIAGDYDKARDRFTTAAEEAVRLADFRVEATARIGLLEVELEASADPSDKTRIDKLLEQAADAVQRAGGDKALATSVEQLRAASELARGDFKDGLDHFEAARRQLLVENAYRSAAVATFQEIDAFLSRGAVGDLEAAWKVGVHTETLLASSHLLVPSGRLASRMASVAWRRGDLDEVHARADKLDRDTPQSERATITGHVVGPDGAPVADARVVAWAGPLDGDATRAFTTRDFDGEVALTDATGAFTMLAPKDAAMIAEHGTLRSEPVPAGAQQTLELLPVRTLGGHVDSTDVAGVDAFVRMWITAKASWTLRTPVGADGAFALAGFPGTRELGVLGLEGTGPRRAAKQILGRAPRDGARLVWPNGPALDVIVRGAPADVVVLRGRTVPRAADELAKRAGRESDAVRVPAGPIGFANLTREGQAKYARGDLHAVIRDNAPGDVIACALWQDAKVPPTCTIVPVTATPTTLVTILTAPAAR